MLNRTQGVTREAIARRTAMKAKADSVDRRARARAALSCEKSGPIAHFRHGFLQMVTRRHLACYCGRPVEELDVRAYREAAYRG